MDIGSGFGGFMFHAQQKFGVKVTGINTTTSQVEMVRAEIARRGLGGSLEVIDTDFRDARRQYDKVVSIGTLEHAGRDSLEEVVRAHAAFLKPGGLGMLHFIGHVGHFQTEFFIRKHVFPGGWIPSLAHTIAAMERAGLEVVDIENLRRHYALTLDAWAERFERNWEQDPRARPEAVRRALPAHLARVPGRLRRDVPLAEGLHAPVPDRVLQGQHHAAELPDEPGIPLRTACTPTRRER